MFDASGTWWVIGLARSGEAAAALLRRRGARVYGCDDTDRDVLEERWTARGLDPAAACDDLLCGPEWWRRLEAPAGVVISPGVPLDHPAVAALRDRVPVIGELELGWRFLRGRAVAITGTNGKTTTTELTAHLLRAAGIDAHALGNLGRPLCAVVDDLGPDAVAVLETSSFQLETLDSFTPMAAAVLNLAPDHLDRYPDLAAYYAAKRNLCDALGPEGRFVTWTACTEALSWTAPRRTLFGERRDGASVFLDDDVLTRARPDGDEPVLTVGELGLRGGPNRLNAMAATALIEDFDVDAATLAAGLRTFTGLEHRQQTVARCRGVDFVDDSKATNVHAVCAGLSGYDRDVVLILGGSGKGEDYGPLREALGPVRHVVLIGDEADAIGAALDGAAPASRAATMDEAVVRAAAVADGRGTVLLSPACASFDMFVDYHARGAAFAAAARRWCDGDAEVAR